MRCFIENETVILCHLKKLNISTYAMLGENISTDLQKCIHYKSLPLFVHIMSAEEYANKIVIAYLCSALRLMVWLRV